MTQASQSGRHSPSLWGRRQSGFPVPSSYFLARQAGRHSPSLWGRRQFFSGSQSSFPGSQAVTFQPGAHLPSGEGCNSAAASQASQAGTLLPTKEGSRQAGTLLPPGKGITLVPSPASQAGTQASQAGALLPCEEGSRQAGALLPLGKDLA